MRQLKGSSETGQGQIERTRGGETGLTPFAFTPAAAAAVPGSAKRDIPAMLLAQRKTIAACAGACFVIAAAYLLIAPSQSISAARLAIDRGSAGSSAGADASDAAGASADRENLLATQCEVIKSMPVLGLVLSDPAVSKMAGIAAASDAMAYLKNSISAEVDRKDGIINVSVSSRDSADATDLLTRLISTYQDFNAAQSQSTSADSLKALTAERDARAKDLLASRDAMLAFKQANAVISFDSDRGNLVEDRLAQIGAQLTAAQRETIQAQAEVEEYGLLHGERLRIAQRVQDDLQKEFDQQKAAALDLNQKQSEYLKLQSDYQQARDAQEVLQNRIIDLHVSQTASALNIRVIEPAHPADPTALPRAAMTLVGALAIGLIGGGGYTLVRGWNDVRLRTAEDVAAVMGMPALGVVARMDSRLLPSARGKMVQLDPTSDAAECYRGLRAEIHFLVPKLKTLLITSPMPGEGKTTLASNLAIAMAQAGRRVLLVDADLRKPSLRALLGNNARGVPGDSGLTRILSGKQPLDEAIGANVAQTDIPNLSALFSGPPTQNPSELLNTAAFEQLLESLRDRFDHVLLDSPPVLRMTDARILASMCDATLLTVRAEATRGADAHAAYHAMERLGAQVLGVVLNDAARRRDEYYTSDRHHQSPAPTMRPISVLLTPPPASAGALVKAGQ